MAVPSSRCLRLSGFIAAIVIAGLAASACSFAQTSESANEKGYRDCNLRRLEACDNTNQIFTGLRGPGWSHSYHKPELPAAIEKFMRRMSSIDVVGHSFTTSEVVEESLYGPGSRFHFPSGEWFFDGFTPHNATEQAAVIFDATGQIVLLATLQTNMNIPPKGGYGGYTKNLTIYLHSPEPDGKFVDHVVAWACDTIAERNRTYPLLPSDEMGTIAVVTASKDQTVWVSRIIK
ncbi:MAG: hypothetical protein P4L57_10360 [Rhizomicrobium sp.]|nr:hypothetical protein [Rhizomicrobium sp.]